MDDKEKEIKKSMEKQPHYIRENIIQSGAPVDTPEDVEEISKNLKDGQ